MKPLLLTGYDERFAPLGELTVPRMADYADRHGLDFHCCCAYDADTHPAWQKLRIVADVLRTGAPWVLWLDADILITAPEMAPPHPFLLPLTVGRDWGEDATGPADFSTSAFVILASAGGLMEFAQERRQWANAPLWDQSALREIWHAARWMRDWTEVRPHGDFGTVPEEVCPGRVPRPWQPGDWLCHLTMIPLEERVRLFHKIIARLP